jgi:hypothetical protein
MTSWSLGYPVELRLPTVTKRCSQKLMAGHLAPFFQPGPPVFQGPIKQGVFKTDVVAGFLALDPFVTKDLLAFG